MHKNDQDRDEAIKRLIATAAKAMRRLASTSQYTNEHNLALAAELREAIKEASK